MNTFVRLSRHDGYRIGDDVRIAVDQISRYENSTRDNYAFVTLKDGTEFRVAQTADQIDRLISQVQATPAPQTGRQE